MITADFGMYDEIIHYIEKEVEEGDHQEFKFLYTTDDSLLGVLQDVDYLLFKRGFGDKIKLSIKEITSAGANQVQSIRSYSSGKEKGNENKLLFKIKVISA